MIKPKRNAPFQSSSIVTAAFYGRFSTKMQRAASIEDQLRCCQQKAEALGWVLLGEHIYKDEGISGTSRAHRPGLAALLIAADTEQPPFKYVIFDDCARLGRNSRDVQNIVAELKEHGVGCYFVSFEMDSASGIFPMQLGMVSAMDEMAITRLKEKVHAGHVGRFSNGYHVGAIPYGYFGEKIQNQAGLSTEGHGSFLGTKLRLQPDEAKIARRIKQEFADGKSEISIARVLNTESVPRLHRKTAGIRKLKWTDSTIKAIVHNQIYTGLRRWNVTTQYLRKGKLTKKKKPENQVLTSHDESLRIISDELHAAVQARLLRMSDAQNKRRLGGYNRAQASINPFSGVLFCGLCGRALTLGGKQDVSTYGCPNYRVRTGCKNSFRVRSDAATHRLAEHLQKLLLHPDVLDVFVPSVFNHLQIGWKEKGAAADELHNLTERRAANGRKIVNLTLAIEEGGPGSLSLRLRDLEEENVRTDSALRALRATSKSNLPQADLLTLVKQVLENLLAAFNADPQTARHILQKHLRLTLTPAYGVDRQPILNVFSEVDLQDGFDCNEKGDQLVSGESTLTAYQLKYRLAAFLPPLELERVLKPLLLEPLTKLLLASPAHSGSFHTPKEWSALIDPYLPKTMTKRPMYAGALGRYLSRDRSQLEEYLSLECVGNPKTPGFLWRIAILAVRKENETCIGASPSSSKLTKRRWPIYEPMVALFTARPNLSKGWLNLRDLVSLMQPHVPMFWPQVVSSKALGRYFRNELLELEEHFAVTQKKARSGPGFLWQLQLRRTLSTKVPAAICLADPIHADFDDEMFDFTSEWVEILFSNPQFGAPACS